MGVSIWEGGKAANVAKSLDDIAHNLGVISGEYSKNLFRYAGRTMQFFYGAMNLPETIVLDFSGNTTLDSMNGMFSHSAGVKTVIVKSLKLQDVYPDMTDFIRSRDVETLIFDDCNFAPSTCFRMCEYASNLETIIGELDLSHSADNSMFYGAAKIKEVRFKANTAIKNVYIHNSTQNLTDDSLISICNGLNDSVTGKTIQINHTHVSRLNNLLGVNNNGVFEKNDQGTLTLTNFVTNVKGWTIA